MLPEQLQGLAADVQRLLMTGGNAAAEDKSLGRRAVAFRELAQKVPALAPLADAIERVTRATSREATPALLQLVLVVRQVQSSLARSDGTGDVAALEPSGPWTTTNNARELQLLAEVLDSSSSERAVALERSLERPGFADLRLFQPLIGCLNSDSQPLVDVLLNRALPAYGPGLLMELKRKLNFKGDRRDARQMSLLCKLEPKSAKLLCHKTLAEGNWVMQVQALRSLGEADPAEAERTALKLLEEKPVNQVRGAALEALGGSKKDAVLDLLLEGLAGGDAVSRGAYEGLKKSAHPKVGQRLLEALHSAVEVMVSLSPPPTVKGSKKRAPKPAPLSKKDQQRKNKTEEMIRKLTDILVARGDLKGLETVLELMIHPVEDVRECAFEPLSEIGPSAVKAVPLLIKALEHDHEDRRAAIATALGDIGPAAPQGLPALVRLLDDKRWWVQSNVIEAMEKFGELAVGPLSEALNSDNPQVRATAARALGDLGPKAVGVIPELLPLLKDKSSEVRQQVVFALGQIAAESAAELAPKIVPTLIPLLTDKDKAIKEAAFMALRDFGSEGKAALPALVKALKDKDAETRRNAAFNISALEHEAEPAIPELKKMLKDRSPNVRNSVKYVLEELGAS